MNLLFDTWKRIRGSSEDDNSDGNSSPDGDTQDSQPEDNSRVKIDDIDTSLPRREYAGMTERYPIVVRVVYNHLFLSRKYGRKGEKGIKISWRFNLHGRIDLIDARLLPEKDIYHLIQTRNFKNIPSNWNSEIAFHYPLPERVDILNPGFHKRRKWEKYQSLMRFGHSMARDIITCMEDDSIRDAYVLGPQQKQLNEISDDPSAVRLLRNAVANFPSIRLLNDKVMRINYQPSTHS